MITSDFHMHTEFSFDSNTSVRDMIEASIQKGLRTICITDHNDKDYSMDTDGQMHAFTFDVDRYFEVLLALQKEYADRIDVRIGIEIGLQPHLVDYYRDLTTRYPFDFVIGSVHVVEGSDPHAREIFKGKEDHEVYRKTFEITKQNLEVFDDFDVLGHIDYVVRYGEGQANAYSYARYQEELDEILKRVIEKGKGIELNSAGLKYGLEFCHPHPDVLKRYRELGGEIITIGADGHKPEHIAYQFQRAAKMLEACGFRYHTIYQQRKPRFVPLESR
jgi:histidinol-phosphatase (PHP family)